MWIIWRNDGFDEDAIIENYLQWEDPENEREFFGMTCKKNRDNQGFLDVIENFKGPSPSLKVSDDQYVGRIHSRGNPGIFKQADPYENETEWAKAKKTRSICSAKAVMWSMTDGKATDKEKELNERYYSIHENNNSTLSISSGYRALKGQDTLSQGDAPTFEYKLKDLGKKRPQ